MRRKSDSELLNGLLGARDIDCERMVLSEILTTRRMVLDVEPDYFTDSRRSLFDALQSQWARNGEIVPDLLKAGYSDAMIECLDVHGSSGKAVIERLRDACLKRWTGKLICESISIDNPTEALNAMQGWVAEALYSHKSTTYDHHDVLRRLFEAMERGVKEKRTVVGYPTGIPEYDLLTNGYEPGKLYVVGALKKTGKSRFMVHNAIQCAHAGAGVLIDSLEMTPIRLNQLALAYYSGLSSSKIGRMMTKREYDQLATATGQIANLTWRIYSDRTVAALRSRIIYERTKADVNVVFVDFIQRLREDAFKGDRTREVERISMDLADMARDLDVAMVALAQLKGEAENVGSKRRGERKWQSDSEDDMPDMRHLKESQGIGENADVITTLHNPTRHENPYTADGAYRLPTMMCKVEQRDDVSGTVIRFRADLRTCRFEAEHDE